MQAPRPALGGGNGAGRVALSLRDLTQLFHSLDPSPFHEKDLDPAASEFLLSRCRDEPRDVPLVVEVFLERAPEGSDVVVRDAIANHFAYQSDLTRRDLVDLLRRGRVALCIGVVFLSACLALAHSLDPRSTGFLGVLRESLVIGGWVAMWRPLEIFLYDWWPLARRVRLLSRIAAATVEVRRVSFSPPGPLAQSVRAGDS